MTTSNRGPVTDYHTLYKALTLRCHEVAEKIRFAASCVDGMILTTYNEVMRTGTQVNARGYLDDLADTLDTPIAADDAARMLHLGDTP